MRALIIGILFLLGAPAAASQQLPIFDAHIHRIDRIRGRMKHPTLRARPKWHMLALIVRTL
ncbi:MAG: hypothetical protein A3G24_23900 [Betaproteobacteria bacterium RIFCSPLOWO2_12_FULL_62_13]|nr:MAG: hypothetical protein A3G24_23900 [Betaproteobacteria bacterium RIFCSPLOWO2_12_FULL_62_13]